LVTVSGAVLSTFGAGEWLRHRARWASERTRKLAHIGCGVIVFFFPYLFHSVHTVGVLSAAFLLLLASTRVMGFMRSVHAVRRNTGGAYLYPVAIYATALLTWDRPALFQISVLLLALADGLAALVGKRYGRHRYRLGSQFRTLEGSATVLGVSALVTIALLGLSGMRSTPEALAIGLLVGGLVCAIEALSLWGADNLLIPVAGALYLRWAAGASEETLLWHVGAGLLSLAISTACHYRDYLKLNGAVAAWLVAYATLGFGGVAWFAPLLGFFLAINWVGKLAERLAADRLPRDFERVEEKGSRRDYLQVFANAGVCLALAIAHAIRPDPVLFWAYMGSLSAACADTFASEVGILSRSRPVLLWTFRPVPAGLSGGVTLFGYAAATVGAVLPVGILAAVGSPYGIPAGAFAGAVACGLFGCTVDSLAGATLQAKRQCRDCGRVLEKREHCGVETRHYSGLPAVTNDAVNAIGAASGALAGAWLALL
jgi:uncharacterized protein (TIGR00297 family)